MSKSNWPAPTMMLKSSNWGPTESFSLMPISNDCPYIEGLYNPMAKTLAIIGKTKKDTFHMIPRLDENGRPERLKVGATEQEPYKKQRVQQESYTEYYITEESEIVDFIKAFTVNHEDFDYQKTLKTPTMDNPGGIMKGAQLIVEK